MRTKIVATLGPASANHDTMKAMVENGVRIFRLNFSHSNAEGFKPAIRIIRELETETGIPLTAMGDLCGPKIRIGRGGWSAPEHRPGRAGLPGASGTS